MKKTKLYRYFGRNGVIVSPILLENVEPVKLFNLVAGEGKLLTNGDVVVKTITIFEEELKDWSEIDDHSEISEQE
jgi:hypothetical protein